MTTSENSEIFHQIAIDIIQALKENNNALVCKKLNYCVKKIKSVRTQNNVDKRTKFTLSAMIECGINSNKQFKYIKNYPSNTGQILRNVLTNNNIQSENISLKTTYNTMKAYTLNNWADDSSGDEAVDEVVVDEAVVDEVVVDEAVDEEAVDGEADEEK